MATKGEIIMKKLICIISTLLFLAGTLVSCANETTTVTTATTATTAPQISAEQIKAQGFFTGTVKSISNETMLEINVDDTYFEELGKTVTVSIKKEMSIKSGDKIRICF